MDLFPLMNSLRIALISTFIIFFVGIFAAYYIAKAPRALKGVLDVILTLPLVLPPTVVGYLLLRVLGPKRVVGKWFLAMFGIKLTMTWWSAIFATTVVIFPLMYRTARGAFEAFDQTLAYSAQSIGLSNTYIFWRIRMPYCKQGIMVTRRLPILRSPLGSPIPISSGGSACRTANRGSWRALSLLLPGHLENMALRV